MAQSLVGTGVTISNAVYSGASIAAGTCSSGAGILDFDGGVVLSSGSAVGIIGPNSGNCTTSNFTLGDPDLDLIAGVATHDAAVLEFDVVPQNAQIRFDFVFGSDEYPEFVGSFNDPMGLYVNGQNVALIPGTAIPVSINNVNASANGAYFVDNSLATRNTGMDGFTAGLFAVAQVTPGVPNHMKLAIADASDFALDSWVMVKAGSIAVLTDTPTPTPTASPTLSPSPTSTVTPTPSPSPTSTASPTITPTRTATPTATPTFTITPTFTETPLPLLLTPHHPSPNPGGPDAIFLPYTLSVPARVSIKVFDISGELVRRLDLGFRLQGNHEEPWDLRNDSGAGVASGVYLCRIEAQSQRGERQDVFEKCAVLR